METPLCKPVELHDCTSREWQRFSASFRVLNNCGIFRKGQPTLEESADDTQHFRHRMTFYSVMRTKVQRVKGFLPMLWSISSLRVSPVPFLRRAREMSYLMYTVFRAILLAGCPGLPQSTASSGRGSSLPVPGFAYESKKEMGKEGEPLDNSTCQ